MKQGKVGLATGNLTKNNEKTASLTISGVRPIRATSAPQGELLAR